MVANSRLRQCSSTGAIVLLMASSVAKGRYPSMADSNREVARPNLVFCSRFRRQSKARIVKPARFALATGIVAKIAIHESRNSLTGVPFRAILLWKPRQALCLQLRPA
jgi:hypothetical protein